MASGIEGGSMAQITARAEAERQQAFIEKQQAHRNAEQQQHLEQMELLAAQKGRREIVELAAKVMTNYGGSLWKVVREIESYIEHGDPTNPVIQLNSVTIPEMEEIMDGLRTKSGPNRVPNNQLADKLQALVNAKGQS